MLLGIVLVRAVAGLTHSRLSRTGRPLADRYRTNNAAMIGRLLRVMPRPAHTTATPEMLDQLLLQGATGLDIV